MEPARYTARNAESRYFNGFLDDGSFWDHQALSLVILATSDRIRTFRLANRLTYMAEASDRFYMKPLLRAVTHPQSAYILAVSENAVRLVDGAGEVEAQKERVPDMPKDAASAAGKVSINDSGAGELRPCSRTEGYFTPVRERGTK